MATQWQIVGKDAEHVASQVKLRRRKYSLDVPARARYCACTAPRFCTDSYTERKTETLLNLLCILNTQDHCRPAEDALLFNKS